MNRRDFVKAAAASGPFLGNVLGANDRIVAGQIGCGGRGTYELRVNKALGIEVAAVADVYDPLIRKAIRTEAPKAEGYKDFRRILDRKDIDVVFVSTPDHWHALATIMACQAGKDVYCEKPLTHTIEEGRRMVQAARKYNRIVQTGSQQRSAPHFQKVVELVRGGYIGEVSAVECWNVGNQFPKGYGAPPDTDPPPGLDWDMYLGPSPAVPYNRNRFSFNYRWFWDYSGGWMTDWGAHHMDIVQWAMNVDAPKSVASMGGRHCTDNCQTPDTIMTVFDYGKFIARYELRNVNSRIVEGRPYGMTFHGDKGTIVVDRSGFEVMPERLPDNRDQAYDRLDAFMRADDWTVYEGIWPDKPHVVDRCEAIKVTDIKMEPAIQEAHVKNFLDCARTRQTPVADVEIGHRSVTACHLGVIAYRLGRQVNWDAANERIVGDAEAQAMTTKKYREPWALPG